MTTDLSTMSHSDVTSLQDMPDPFSGLKAKISETPLDHRLWSQFGQELFTGGQAGEAVRALREALRLDPQNAGYYGNLGIALRADGRLGEAEALLREAIRREPNNPLTRFAIGNLFTSMRRYEEAAAAFTSALAKAPGFFAAFENLVSLLIDMNRIADALKLIEENLRKNPNDQRLLSILAITLDKSGNSLPALEVTLRAIELDPPTHLDMRLASFVSLTGRAGRIDLRPKVRALLMPAITASLNDSVIESNQFDRNAFRRFIFLFPYYGIQDRDLMKVHSAVSHSLAASLRSDTQPLPSDTDALRIGFISHNYGDHPIGHLLSHFFEAHGHERHKLYLYATHIYQNDASGYGERIQNAADHFIDCRGLSDQALVERIRNDRLHILIDLDGYMHGGRPEVFAMRVAPIQIHWLQSLAGCPAPYFDYTIVDRVLVPDDERDQGNGPLIRLADAFQCGEILKLPELPPRRTDHHLPDDAFVYCAFGNWLKIDDDVFAAWMEILAAIPKSVLWLTAGPTPDALNNLKRQAEAHGISGNRLIVAPRTADKLSHIDRHRCADLYIDTFTFSAATSATDALSAGLPVLTKKGTTAQSRLAESLIRATGYTALIVEDRTSYIETAIALARDPVTLDRHRKAVAEAARSETALFNPHRLVRQFERLYDHVIERHRAGNRPQHFDIEGDA